MQTATIDVMYGKIKRALVICNILERPFNATAEIKPKIINGATLKAA